MGIFLVFDLDETIVASSDKEIARYKGPKNDPDFKKIVYGKINTYIIDILVRAIKLKGKGVDMIVLLTNNSDEEYISIVDEILASMVGIDDKTVFDYRMTMNDPSRHSATKSLHDVKFILAELKQALRISYKSDEDILSRTYFFDNMVNHVLQDELSKSGYADHYILIEQPLSTKEVGHKRMEYDPIFKTLKELEKKAKPRVMTLKKRKTRRANRKNMNRK